MVLVFGALLGFVSVAFGGYAEHGLRESITDENFRSLMTAVRYNQVHAPVIIAIGLALLLKDEKLGSIKALKWSGLLFIIGTALFSFSIYISVSFKIPSLMNITPIGGMVIMAAWLLLLTAGLIMTRRNM